MVTSGYAMLSRGYGCEANGSANKDIDNPSTIPRGWW